MLPPLAIKPISEERMFRFPEQGKQGREKHRADCDLVRRPGHSPRAALAAWQQGLSLANKGSEAKTASVTTPSLLQRISNFIQNHRFHLLGR
jgi:hypothetical protein